MDMIKLFFGVTTILAAMNPDIGITATLSAKAKPLTSAEVKKIYSGKSANWTKTRAYFAPDGRYLMIAKDKSWYAEGKWSVSGNEACSTALLKSVKDDFTKELRNCWIWYRNGKGYQSIYSGEKDRKNGYWDKERRQLSTGDKVSRDLMALKKKAGQ